jgi:hypothetical protein
MSSEVLEDALATALRTIRSPDRPEEDDRSVERLGYFF